MNEDQFYFAPSSSPRGQEGKKQLHLLNEYFEANGINPGKGAEICINYALLVVRNLEEPSAVIKRQLEGLAKVIQKLAEELP